MLNAEAGWNERFVSIQVSAISLPVLSDALSPLRILHDLTHEAKSPKPPMVTPIYNNRFGRTLRLLIEGARK
jgi:hypothetical protein